MINTVNWGAACQFVYNRVQTYILILTLYARIRQPPSYIKPYLAGNYIEYRLSRGPIQYHLPGYCGPHNSTIVWVLRRGFQKTIYLARYVFICWNFSMQILPRPFSVKNNRKRDFYSNNPAKESNLYLAH